MNVIFNQVNILPHNDFINRHHLLRVLILHLLLNIGQPLIITLHLLREYHNLILLAFI